MKLGYNSYMSGMIEKKKRRYEGHIHDIGKWLVDISKLAFGSLVLGSVIRWDISQVVVFAVGVIFSGALAFVGIYMTRLFKED